VDTAPTIPLAGAVIEDTARVIIRDLVKSYRLGDEKIDVLQGLSLDIAAGELVAIMGPSGAGKTTLLNCISGIDRPDGGSVAIGGKEIDFDSETARTRLRRYQLGMVFQFFNLVPTLTVRENITLPFMISRRNGPGTPARVDALLETTGLMKRADHRPHQLSGGEMQLTSIARALVHRPTAVLADEPTGNVNPVVGRSIMKTLRKAAKSEDISVLMVTHSAEHAAWTDRVCFLKDGQIAEELRHGGASDDIRPIHDVLLALGI
jgi:putative ABC transport system ATP-binding protein